MEVAYKSSSFKINFITRIKKLGQDDPRRIVHSFKVALAITLVSMVYYLRPLYKGIGDAGVWAILTVVVVFEYTAGATLCKGMNRGLATLLAGVLGIGAKYLASLFGTKAEPIVLGFLVFLLVASATFSRFIPHIKRRYDYGVLIFILTFSLVAVSGYRVDKILELAHQRLSTILIGGATCIVISICVCPVWAGEDLHNLIVSNLEKVASFLEGFGGENFEVRLEGDIASNEPDKSFLTAYKSVLNSKATEESLANFAWWEPGHGKFRFSHPWKQYLKIGVLTRQCGYHIEALNGYLDTKFQCDYNYFEPYFLLVTIFLLLFLACSIYVAKTLAQSQHPPFVAIVTCFFAPPASSEFSKRVQEPCTKISSEAGKALKELAQSVKSFSYPSNCTTHLQTCQKAIHEVNTTLKASMVGECDVLEIIPMITIASTLIEIAKCVETVCVAIEELSKQAHFKKSLNDAEKSQAHHGGAVASVDDHEEEEEDIDFVKVIIHKIPSESQKTEDNRG